MTSVPSGFCRLGRLLSTGVTCLLVTRSRLLMDCGLLGLSAGLVVWNILPMKLIVVCVCLVLTCVVCIRNSVMAAAVSRLSVVIAFKFIGYVR